MPIDAASSGYTNTLYKCTIPAATLSGAGRVRIYLWHSNASSDFLDIQIIGSSYPDTISPTTLSNFAYNGVFASQSSLLASGRCLAEAQAFQTYDAPSSDRMVSLGSSEQIIYEFAIPSSEGGGAIVEFDVNPGTYVESVTFRIAASIGQPDSILGTPSEAPAWEPIPHVRGWWPYSELLIDVNQDSEANRFDASPTSTDAVYGDASVCEDTGIDTAAFAKQSSDTWGTSSGNLGCYGVDLHYTFYIKNTSTTQTGNVYVYAMGRGTGTSTRYTGAMQIETPSGYDQRSVPPIRGYIANEVTPPPSFAYLYQEESGALQPVSVPVNTSSKHLTILGVNAGAATLPMTIRISRDQLTIEEVGGGG